MLNRSSLVQAEFFLPEGSLKFKQTVRFFDYEEKLAILALQIEMLEAKRSFYLHRFYRAINREGVLFENWLEKKYCAFVCDCLAQKLCKLTERKLKLALDGFYEAPQNGGVAVEKIDHTFRPALSDELQGLFKAVENARGVWLFVFSHAELCASEKLVSVAAAM